MKNNKNQITTLNFEFQEVLNANFKKQKWYEMFLSDNFISSDNKTNNLFNKPGLEIENVLKILNHLKIIISMITINKLSINLTIETLNNWIIINYFNGIIKENNIDFSKLCIEISEDKKKEFLSKDSINMLIKLRDKGSKIAIDNFNNANVFSPIIKLGIVNIIKVNVPKIKAKAVSKLRKIVKNKPVETVATGIDTPADLYKGLALKLDFLQGKFLKGIG